MLVSCWLTFNHATLIIHIFTNSYKCKFVG
nr:MAG TPA: hypothetical protein [Caudoviricetes sp.]